MEYGLVFYLLTLLIRADVLTCSGIFGVKTGPRKLVGLLIIFFWRTFSVEVSA